jgi:predicted small integral membrane protein
MEDVIIIATRCHTMCNVMSFATNMSFVTCLMQLDTIVVACDIYELKLIVNPIVSTQLFSSDL